jgi:prephenate dehydrogenase
VALAARRVGVTVHLHDLDAASARTAQALGAGVAGLPRRRVDLAVAAVPPRLVGEVLAGAQARGLARSYTDVASVKGEPERAVLRLAPDPSGYAGGHPMAGSERSGPLAARGDLFAGRPWAITPSAVSGRGAVERATALAVLCGAVPVVMSSAAHDEAVALTSHAPHLLASLMAARLAERPAEASRLAGPGLRDVTRIAAGDPALWTDIVRANAPAVAGVLRDLHADLSRLLPALDALADRAGPVEPTGPVGHGGPEQVLAGLLERGVAGVGRLPGLSGPARGARDAGVRLGVALPGRPGELPELLAALDAAGVDGDGVDAQWSGPDRMTVRFSVAPQAAPQVRAVIASGGWAADLIPPS